MNNLNEDLTDKHIILKKSVLRPQYRDLKHRIVSVNGGYGASPSARGTALFVTHANGQETGWNGHDVERFATDDEIRAHFVKSESVV